MRTLGEPIFLLLPLLNITFQYCLALLPFIMCNTTSQLVLLTKYLTYIVFLLDFYTLSLLFLINLWQNNFLWDEYLILVALIG